MIKIVIAVIAIWLVYRYWEGIKVASAVFVVMTVLIALEIAFYIYCFMSAVFNRIRRQK